MELSTLVLTWIYRIAVALLAVSAILLLVVNICRANAFALTCMAVLVVFSVVALINIKEEK